MSSSRYAFVAFFALMVIQISVAVVYKLAQKGGRYHFSPASALTMAEFFKFCISAGMQLHQEWPKDLHQASFFARFRSAVVQIYDKTMDSFSVRQVGQCFTLGFLYAVNNHFAFVLFMLADASSITLIKSGSSFISTILAVTLLAKTVTSPQWISVLLQVCGLIMAQYNPCKSATLLTPFAYLLLFIHVLISGFNGIWNEDIVKNGTTSLASQNLLLYAAGFLFNLWAYIILPNSFYGAPEETSFFTGYTPSAIMVVVLNSTIGVVITAVYKYADVIIKTFAMACSTGSLFIIEYLFFKSELSLNIFVGIIVVYLASYVYLTTGPPKPAAAPGSDDKGPKKDSQDDVNFCTAIIPTFLIQRCFAPAPQTHLP